MVWIHSLLQAISSEVDPNGDWDKAVEVVVQLRLGDEGFVGGHPGVASRHRIGGVASRQLCRNNLEGLWRFPLAAECLRYRGQPYRSPLAK